MFKIKKEIFKFLTLQVLVLTTIMSWATGHDSISKEIKLNMYSSNEFMKLDGKILSESRTPKECILFIPGLMDSWRNHTALFDFMLSKKYGIGTFTLEGFDKSEGGYSNHIVSFEKNNIHNIVYQIEILKKQMYKELNCRNSPVIIGFSLGGLAAFKYSQINLTSKLILLSPALTSLTDIKNLPEKLQQLKLEEKNNENLTYKFPSNSDSMAIFKNANEQIEKNTVDPIINTETPTAVFLAKGDLFLNSEETIEILSHSTSNLQTHLYSTIGGKHRLDSTGKAVHISNKSFTGKTIDWTPSDLKRLFYNLENFIAQ